MHACAAKGQDGVHPSRIFVPERVDQEVDADGSNCPIDAGPCDEIFDIPLNGGSGIMGYFEGLRLAAPRVSSFRGEFAHSSDFTRDMARFRDPAVS